ncbi:hypothetical protein J437_LFUL012096, partial [Ladona fulva]
MCSTSAATTQKTFPELKEIDSLLRCGICYEYMKNTLVTSCSHNYCSYCIRKFMQYKTQCPTCFKETAEPQLRNNRVVDQLIVLFLKVSEKIEDLAGQKDWYIVDTSKTGDDSENHLLNKSVEGEHRRDVSIYPRPQESPSTSTPRMKILVPDMFTPKRKVKIRPVIEENVQTVPCPVCNVDIPERNINLHLDACLAKSKEDPKSSHQTPMRKPLPKLVYPLLQEKDLRRKLKELGLNTLGDRKTLINRHQRFTVLYNSECDSLNPRSVSEILDQVAQEERLEKKQTSGNTLITAKAWLTVDKKSDPNSIEEAQKQYLRDNKASFAVLIEKAKNQREASTSEKTENYWFLYHHKCSKRLLLEYSSLIIYYPSITRDFLSAVVAKKPSSSSSTDVCASESALYGGSRDAGCRPKMKTNGHFTSYMKSRKHTPSEGNAEWAPSWRPPRCNAPLSTRTLGASMVAPTNVICKPEPSLRMTQSEFLFNPLDCLEPPGPSNVEIIKSIKKESPEKLPDRAETNSCDSIQDSPEICSVAEIAPHVAASSLHSSFDMFEQPNSSPVANSKNIKGSVEKSPAVSPLRADGPPLDHLRTPSGKSTSAVSSPRTPDFTPNGPAQFSPNFCIKPIRDGERTPSPPPSPPKSPIFPSRNAAKENKDTNASSALANDD